MKPTTRKVVRRSPANTVRLLHLPQLQPQPVEAESALERDFVHCAALYPLVTSIRHQPFKLVWEDASYTPDFLLTFLDQSRLVVEVKPQERVHEYHDLFQRAERKLQDRGLQFLVATDRLTCKANRHENARLIRRYAKAAYPLDACQALVDRVSQAPMGLTVSELCAADMHLLSLLRHLICKRQLATQVDLSTQPTAIISIPNYTKGLSHALQFSNWFDA